MLEKMSDFFETRLHWFGYSNYGMAGRANTNFCCHWFNYHGNWVYDFCYWTIHRKQQKSGFYAIRVYQHLGSKPYPNFVCV